MRKSGKLLALQCILLAGLGAAAHVVPAAGQQENPSKTPAERAAWTKANGHYDSGNHLLKAKRYKEAIAKYREAIQLWPSSAPYHYNLALALKHSGNGAEAVAEFQKALELNGNDWKCWKALGNTQYRLGQFAQAKASFENVLQHSPPAADAAEMRSGIAACGARIPAGN